MIGVVESVSALRFLLDCGVDEVIGEEPTDWSALSPRARTQSAVASPAPARPAAGAAAPQPAPRQNVPPPMARPADPGPLGAAEAGQSARLAASAAQTLDELKEALAAFDGCALKKTATNLVFGMGS
ncbi:MAG: uracil-DNA glycosylase, partial [Niveispirillum sp.]|nr:uracil-DNA glycosylase [Niveispirillum sp.]